VTTRPVPPIAGAEHHYVEAGGIRIHYAEAGDPAGEPLVLLHGWPQHHYMWRRVIPLLADRFRIIAPDLRGFGWSDAPDASYAKTEFRDDTIALLDALGLDRVRLAGHDWGGWTSFLVAIAAPERVSALRAFSITHPWAPAAPRPQDAVLLAYQPLIGMPVLGPAIQRFTPALDLLFKTQGDWWDEEDRRIYSEAFKESDRAEAASRVYRTFITREVFDSGPDERLTVPTRLVVGKGDPVIHAQRTEEFEEHADDMTVEFVDGSHWLPEERPELVADRIAAD
jgi:pimeloyl-ACP methyl ester carboxylesterase